MRFRLLCTAAFLSASCLAHADEVSHQKAVEDLLEVTHAQAQVDDIRNRTLAQFSEIAGLQVQGELSEAQKATVQRATKEAANLVDEYLSWTAIQAVQASAYKQEFSEEEIRAMSAFYSTPLGQKLLARMPEIVSFSTSEIQRDMQTLLPLLEPIAKKMLAELAGPEKPVAKATKPAKKAKG